MKYPKIVSYQKGGRISDKDLLELVKTKGLARVPKDELSRAKSLLNLERNKLDLTGMNDSYDAYSPNQSNQQPGLDKYITDNNIKGNKDNRQYITQAQDVIGNIASNVYRKLPVPAQQMIQLVGAAGEVVNVPLATVAEGISAARGEDVSVKNVLPSYLGGNQKDIATAAGIENPYLAAGVNLLGDGVTGGGLFKGSKIIKNLPSAEQRQFNKYIQEGASSELPDDWQSKMNNYVSQQQQFMDYHKKDVNDFFSPQNINRMKAHYDFGLDMNSSDIKKLIDNIQTFRAKEKYVNDSKFGVLKKPSLNTIFDDNTFSMFKKKEKLSPEIELIKNSLPDVTKNELIDLLIEKKYNDSLKKIHIFPFSTSLSRDYKSKGQIIGGHADNRMAATLMTLDDLNNPNINNHGVISHENRHLLGNVFSGTASSVNDKLVSELNDKAFYNYDEYNSIKDGEKSKSLDNLEKNTREYFDYQTKNEDEPFAWWRGIKADAVQKGLINNINDDVTLDQFKDIKSTIPHSGFLDKVKNPQAFLDIMNKYGYGVTGAVGTGALLQSQQEKTEYQTGGLLSTLPYQIVNRYPEASRVAKTRPEEFEAMAAGEEGRFKALDYLNSNRYKRILQLELAKSKASDYPSGKKPTFNELYNERLTRVQNTPIQHLEKNPYIWSYKDMNAHSGQTITYPGFDNKIIGKTYVNPASDHSETFYNSPIGTSTDSFKNTGLEESIHLSHFPMKSDSNTLREVFNPRQGESGNVKATGSYNITPYAENIIKSSIIPANRMSGFSDNFTPEASKQLANYTSVPTEIIAQIPKILSDTNTTGKFTNKSFKHMVDNPTIGGERLLNATSGSFNPYNQLKYNKKLYRQTMKNTKRIMNNIADVNSNDIPIAKIGGKITRVIKPANISNLPGRRRGSYYQGNVMQSGGVLNPDFTNINLVDIDKSDDKSYQEYLRKISEKNRLEQTTFDHRTKQLTTDWQNELFQKVEDDKLKDWLAKEKVKESFRPKYQSGGTLKTPILDTQIQNTTQPSFGYNGLKNEPFKYQSGGNAPMYSVNAYGKLNLEKPKLFRATDIKTPNTLKSINIDGAFDNFDDYDSPNSNVIFDNNVKKELNYIDSIRKPEGKSYGAQLTDATGKLIKQLGITALQIPQIPSSIIAESVAAIKGDDYNYKNVLPDVLGGNHKTLDKVLNIKNPYLGFGINFISDPSNWNPLKSAIKLSHSLKYIPKQSFIDLSKNPKIIAANKAKYAEKYVPEINLNIDRNKIIKVLSNSAVLNEAEDKAKEYQSGGSLNNVARTESEMQHGLNAGINQFNFPTKGLKKMTMAPQSGNITDPVIMEGYTDGSLSDRKVAQPGQSNININADTIIEKPDLSHIDDYNEAYDHADRKKYPIFVWKNQEYNLKQHKRNK